MYDSSSNVADMASSSVDGRLCFTLKATSGGVKCCRKALIASCSQTSSWGVR